MRTAVDLGKRLILKGVVAQLANGRRHDSVADSDGGGGGLRGLARPVTSTTDEAGIQAVRASQSGRSDHKCARAE